MWHVFICGVYSGTGRVGEKIWTPFWETKLLIKFVHSCSANISFLIDNMGNPLNLSCDIVDLK